MDKERTGALTLDQFQEYMARENPRSLRKAASLFKAMQSDSPDGGNTNQAPTVTFLEVTPASVMYTVLMRPQYMRTSHCYVHSAYEAAVVRISHDSLLMHRITEGTSAIITY
jgi:hypothetical protein